MLKTSVYLDQGQKADLDRVAALTGRSQAELIREGVAQVIQDHLSTRPALTARFYDEAMVGRVDDLLENLGL
jgi:predicted transcriptional regulator